MAKKTNDDTVLHYLKAVIKNFKNIEAKVVQIDGRSLAIIGGNNQGKSSLIQTLKMIASSKEIPPVPIKEGEERAEIEVTIGGTVGGKREEYRIEAYFTPGNQKGALRIYDKDGNKEDKSVRTKLDSLIKASSFSIDDFLRSPASKQAKELKELSGKANEIDAIDIKIVERKKKISLEKSKFEEQETLLKHHGYSDEEIERYSKPSEPSVEMIEKELAALGPAMEKHAKAESLIKELTDEIQRSQKDEARDVKEVSDNEEEMLRLQKKIEELRKRNDDIGSGRIIRDNQLATTKQRLEKGEEWLKNTAKPDAEKVSQKLSDAKMHDDHHKKILDYEDKQKALFASKQLFQDLHEEVKKMEKQKDDIIASSNLPVKELTFSDDQVFYKGLPMEKGQINTATLLEIGEEICMAKHPNLKTIFVEEGSLYDKPSLKRLVEKAHGRGYQVIAEIVNPAGGELEIKFIEEYLEA